MPQFRYTGSFPSYFFPRSLCPKFWYTGSVPSYCIPRYECPIFLIHRVFSPSKTIYKCKTICLTDPRHQFVEREDRAAENGKPWSDGQTRGRTPTLFLRNCYRRSGYNDVTDKFFKHLVHCNLEQAIWHKKRFDEYWNRNFPLTIKL